MFGFGQSSRRIAIDQLKTQYPNTRELTKNNDFEVPFSVGGYFYNVIVQLGPSFPGSAPVLSINGPGNPPICHEWLDPFQKATKYPALLLWNKNSRLAEVVRVLITTIQQNVPQSGYGYQQQPSQQPRIVSGNVSAAHAVTAVAVTPGQSLQDTPLATVASIRGGSSDVFATVVSASSTPVSASGYAGSISSARPPQPQYPNALGSIKAAPISSTPLVAPLRTNSSTSNTSTASGFQKQSSQFGLMEVVSDPPTRVNSLSKGNSSSFATSSKSEPESPFMEIPTSPTTFPILKGKTEAELEVLLADSKAFKDLVESIVCEDPNVDYLESMRDETRKANLSQAEATLQLESQNALQQTVVNMHKTLQTSTNQYRADYAKLAAQYSVRVADVTNKLREKQDVHDAQSETLAKSIINGRFRGQPNGDDDLARFMQEYLTARRVYHTAVIQTELVQRS